jgi:NADPH-dependent glutamate synthase beta subunit-like oxidoreductase
MKLRPFNSTLIVFKCLAKPKFIGQRLDEEFIRENPEIKTSGGSIMVNKRTGMTSMLGVFVGGDAVGGGTVVQAIAEGKTAANGIDEYLKGI